MASPRISDCVGPDACEEVSAVSMGQGILAERQVCATEETGESCQATVPGTPLLCHSLLAHFVEQGVEMKVNVRKEAQLVNPATGDYLELDAYLPSLNLAFEYQVRFPMWRGM